jgi:hypothetical protein
VRGTLHLFPSIVVVWLWFWRSANGGSDDLQSVCMWLQWFQGLEILSVSEMEREMLEVRYGCHILGGMASASGRVLFAWRGMREQELGISRLTISVNHDAIYCVLRTA